MDILSPPESTISKFYLVKAPNDTVYFVTDLSNFCKINKLNRSILLKVLSGERKHHKRYEIL